VDRTLSLHLPTREPERGLMKQPEYPFPISTSIYLLIKLFLTLRGVQDKIFLLSMALLDETYYAVLIRDREKSAKAKTCAACQETISASESLLNKTRCLFRQRVQTAVLEKTVTKPITATSRLDRR